MSSHGLSSVYTQKERGTTVVSSLSYEDTSPINVSEEVSNKLLKYTELATQLKIYILAYFEAKCGPMSELWPKGCEQK